MFSQQIKNSHDTVQHSSSNSHSVLNTVSYGCLFLSVCQLHVALQPSRLCNFSKPHSASNYLYVMQNLQHKSITCSRITFKNIQFTVNNKRTVKEHSLYYSKAQTTLLSQLWMPLNIAPANLHKKTVCSCSRLLINSLCCKKCLFHTFHNANCTARCNKTVPVRKNARR